MKDLKDLGQFVGDDDLIIACRIDGQLYAKGVHIENWNERHKVLHSLNVLHNSLWRTIKFYVWKIDPQDQEQETNFRKEVNSDEKRNGTGPSIPKV